MQELENRVAVITGGGSGIGEALALACADARMDVVVGDVEPEKAEAVAGAVRERGRRALGVHVDVSDPEAVEHFAERTYAELGACHLLCNNAGVLAVGALHERTLEDWRWLLGVNLHGVIHGIRSFVPRMIASGDAGHIVNTCSSTSLFALPANGAYATTKFAVLGLTETLRLELEEYGIGVSALCPGGVKTEIIRSERNRPSELGSSKLSRKDVDRLIAGGDEANQTAIQPARVAELVLDAVRQNQFYIITHPGSKPLVQKRTDELLAAYDRALALGGLP
jgi:NAD(P)-dependent dehydrogenase (short-subunit alcohol dehydrogenase family)